MTLVLVEQPTVPTDYVKPVVSDDLNRRVESMKQQAEPFEPSTEYRKFNLYPASASKRPHGRPRRSTEKSVEVELMQPMAGARIGNRRDFAERHLRQSTAGATDGTVITSMFMQQNGKRREQQATDTTHFLSQQLEDAPAEKTAGRAKLAQFKRQYLGSLPEESQTNLNILTGYSTQLEAATQALNRAQQDKAFNETMLNQQEINWKAQFNGQPNPESQEQQIAALQAQLSDLLARYTPEHPDVVKVKAQLEEAKKKIQDPATKGPANSKDGSLQPPQPQQLRAKSSRMISVSRKPASGKPRYRNKSGSCKGAFRPAPW